MAPHSRGLQYLSAYAVAGVVEFAKHGKRVGAAGKWIRRQHVSVR